MTESYLATQSLCQDFLGLQEGTNRYDLLLLVKKVGRAAGFTPRMIQLLDYYMAFTRDVDWEEGSRPIVYQSLARTALDLGVSERQIQKLEHALFEAGAISWNDSGNHKRYGQRHPQTGRIRYAFGVELTPLSHLREELQQKLEEKQLYESAWMETKRQISWYRRQIRGALQACREEGTAPPEQLASLEQRYDQIAIQIRTHIRLPELRTLRDHHQSLYSECRRQMGGGGSFSEEAIQRRTIAEKTTLGASTNERMFAHSEPTTQQSFNKLNPSGPADQGFQEGQSEPPEHQQPPPGARHPQRISLGRVVQVINERFRDHRPMDPIWRNFADTADELRRDSGVSRCPTEMGRSTVRPGRGDAVTLLEKSGDDSVQPDITPFRPSNAALRESGPHVTSRIVPLTTIQLILGRGDRVAPTDDISSVALSGWPARLTIT